MDVSWEDDADDEEKEARFVLAFINETTKNAELVTNFHARKIGSIMAAAAARLRVINFTPLNSFSQNLPLSFPG